MNSPELDEVLTAAWQMIVRGKADRRSAFHTPTVATMGRCGLPRQRVMVLRAVDPKSGALRFHTDIRSGKVDDIGDGAPVSVLVYDAKAKVQVRLGGTAVIEPHSEVAAQAWINTSPSSRRAYLVNPGPGTRVDQPMSGLPPEIETYVPSLEASEAGRAAFAVMIVTLNQIEWLSLAASGHRRALFERSGSIWAGQWLIP